MRSAIQEAASAEMPKQPSASARAAEEVEQVGDEALHDHSTAEGVEGEKGRQAGDDAARSMESEPAGDRSVRRFGDLDPRRDSTDQQRQRQPKAGVDDDDGAVGVDWRPIAGDQRPRDSAADQSPGGRGEGSGQVEPGKHAGAGAIFDRL